MQAACPALELLSKSVWAQTLSQVRIDSTDGNDGLSLTLMYTQPGAS